MSFFLIEDDFLRICLGTADEKEPWANSGAFTVMFISLMWTVPAQ